MTPMILIMKATPERTTIAYSIARSWLSDCEKHLGQEAANLGINTLPSTFDWRYDKAVHVIGEDGESDWSGYEGPRIRKFILSLAKSEVRYAIRNGEFPLTTKKLIEMSK
jgi:hypothetical protein